MKYILFLSLLILLSCIQDKSPTIKVINISGIPYDFNRDPSTEINDVLFINDTIGFLAGNFNDLQHVDDNKNIFATSEYNAFIYKTIDGGKTFNKLPSFGNGKIQYLSQCKDELFAVKIVENLGDKYKSIIYHSTDEGESWEAILERDDYINRLKHFSDFSFFVVWNSNEGKNSLYRINGKEIKKILLPIERPLYEFVVFENYFYGYFINSADVAQIIKYNLISQEYKLISLPAKVEINKMMIFNNEVKLIEDSDDKINVYNLVRDQLKEDFVFQKKSSVKYMKDYFESAENKYVLLSIGSAYQLISINKKNQKQEEVYFKENYFINPYFDLLDNGRIKIWFFGSAYRNDKSSIFQKFSE